jgi:hypothetical protein
MSRTLPTSDCHSAKITRRLPMAARGRYSVASRLAGVTMATPGGGMHDTQPDAGHAKAALLGRGHAEPELQGDASPHAQKAQLSVDADRGKATVVGVDAGRVEAELVTTGAKRDLGALSDVGAPCRVGLERKQDGLLRVEDFLDDGRECPRDALLDVARSRKAVREALWAQELQVAGVGRVEAPPPEDAGFVQHTRRKAVLHETVTLVVHHGANRRVPHVEGCV